MSNGLLLDDLKPTVRQRKADMKKGPVRSVRKIRRVKFWKGARKKFFKNFFLSILRTSGLDTWKRLI